MDYLAQYNQEPYIFETVSDRFREQGFINAYDFFCIVIWKANRAKTQIAKKLLEQKFDSLDEAVFTLTSGISKEAELKDKLGYLMKVWRFQLPMASAIMTALYPNDFTVYDIRVCDELGDFHKLKNRLNFENVWSGYQDYKQKVIEATPQVKLLRDKDRFLWGRSFARQLESDIKQGFIRE